MRFEEIIYRFGELLQSKKIHFNQIIDLINRIFDL